MPINTLNIYLKNLPNSNFMQDTAIIKDYLPWSEKVQLECSIKKEEEAMNESA